MGGFAHSEIYDVLYPLSVRTFRGTQEGVYEYRPNPGENKIMGKGYVAPESFAIKCESCCEVCNTVFSPKHLDELTGCLSGLAACNGDCNQEYKVWLIEPSNTNPYSKWREAWITPKPGGEPELEALGYIPDEFSKLKQYFREAHTVFDISLSASAALSRLGLEIIITKKLGINKNSLGREVDSLLKSGKLPSYLAEEVDAIRKIGNFGSHAFEDKSTGEIIDVTSEEALWSLSLFGELLDHCFVRPSRLKARKDALSARLQSAGEGPMMEPPRDAAQS